MAKGGARVNSGPPPDPDALRRERPSDRNGWTMLPAWRTGPVPAWPLRTAEQVVAAVLNHRDGKVDEGLPIGADAARQDGREAQVWAEIWSKPQAVVWEQLGWYHDVALYVRWLVGAEGGDMKAAAEARQWSDRLGLNPAAMLRNRWKVEAAEPDAAEPAKPAARARKAAKRPASSRDRFTVVSGGGEG